MLIPAWHITSINIEPLRSKAFPIGDIAYMGSLYMVILLSLERYMAVRQRRQLTITRTLVYITSVTIFSILYNLPEFWVYVLKTDQNGVYKTKRSELSCTTTFFEIYSVGLNACFKFIIPIACLVGFNIFIYREVMYSLENVETSSFWNIVYHTQGGWKA